ncbi:tetratricopeptide repeat protein [Streptomyces sp. SID8374]|uniref:AfsR/SARP family transcriptional regulator n=1 Tax=Streptomyces sp. SID8374 TaxID=2690354 RepID=UPI00136B5C56|nr:BTAD domain-containing putative transcriptional regulator [Streptomyces sp. SID8374]MYX15475.1 tetratricopeptide repeat protein [Streptomyces sp. SID8374]
MTEIAEDAIRFNILGSLECWQEKQRIRLGGPTQERVLTMLLLEAGRVVTVPRLIEAVWGDAPPATAVQQIRKTVADLRRRLPRGAEYVVTEGAGYRADIAPGQLDLDAFRQNVRDAAADVAGGRSADAVEKLGAALALWRGGVMCGHGGPVIDAAATALAEHRIAATEQFFELRLEAGESGELVGALREAVAEHPLRERLRGRLILALYRSGQQAEALAEYGRVRELLVEELGIDPGAELARLHEDILRGSPELLGPVPAVRSPAPRAPARATPGTGVPAPRSLPYDLSDFTGRERELAQLLEMSSAGRTGIVGVDGMGGAGKSTLAVHAAYRLADDYPDGLLYIDLFGFTPGEQPLQPAAVADALLRQLGVSDAQIPDDDRERFALWRAWTAGRRILLILDNAADTAQVRPLLSGMSHGLVIVVGRVRLLDLDGARWLSLGSMEPEQSALMLTRTLGEARVAAEPRAARALAQLCGHLPLALRIATARLRNRPHWTLQYFVGRLHDESRLLKELCSSERSVATTIQISYQVLEPGQRRAFRLLGLHPGTDIDVHAAAALFGMSPQDAEAMLEALLDVHLLRQTCMGVYSFHDLVRSFARGPWLTTREEERYAALGGLIDYYLAASDRACRTLFPGRVEYAAVAAGEPPELPPLGSPAEAGKWFDRELRALQAAVTLGSERGFPRQAAYLARNTVFQFHQRGDIVGYRETGEAGLHAARLAGDRVAEGFSLRNLIAGHSMRGEFRSAAECGEAGLELVRSENDRQDEGIYLAQVGWAYCALGRLDEGRRAMERAVALLRETGEVMEETIALCNLSSVYTWLGRADDAVVAAERSLRLNQQVNHGMHRAGALNDLAIAHLSGGNLPEALAALDQALELGEEEATPRNLALTHILTADICQRDGRGEQAPAYVRSGLDLAEPLATRPWKSEIENVAGLVHRRRGEHDLALELHGRALRHASASEYRIQMAWAFDGLAQALDGAGEHASAAEHRRSADEHFEAMGVPGGSRMRL